MATRSSPAPSGVVLIGVEERSVPGTALSNVTMRLSFVRPVVTRPACAGVVTTRLPATDSAIASSRRPWRGACTRQKLHDRDGLDDRLDEMRAGFPERPLQRGRQALGRGDLLGRDAHAVR